MIYKLRGCDSKLINLWTERRGCAWALGYQAGVSEKNASVSLIANEERNFMKIPLLNFVAWDAADGDPVDSGKGRSRSRVGDIA